MQGARIDRARQIIAVDTVESKLTHARRFGATDVIDASRCDPMQSIKHLMGGKGVEYTFEAIGTGDTIARAFDATKKGGKCVGGGISRADVRAPINVKQLVDAETSLIGNLYGTTRPRTDLPMLMDMLNAGKLMLEELITRTCRLDQINEACEALLRGEVARSLIVFE